MTRGPTKGRLAETAPEDRPREKLLSRGPDALSDDELLAVILGTGRPGMPVLEAAKEILGGGGFARLFARGPEAFRTLVPGVGPAKAARLSAALEIARRVLEENLLGRDLLASTEEAVKYLRAALVLETREVMGGLFLDAKHRLIRNAVVFRGTMNHAVAAPAPLFREAILCGAVGVVLYHNHPSGDPTPSSMDLESTRRFVAAGQMIGVEVLDHVIVGAGDSFSFRQKGLLR